MPGNSANALTNECLFIKFIIMADNDIIADKVPGEKISLNRYIN